MREEKKFIKDAAIISAGGFISKAIGAAYRIPLVGIIGGKGLGLYQLAFPLYCIFFALSACGASSAVSKLTAGDKRFNGEGIFLFSRRLFTGTGFICAVIMAALAVPIAYMQGEGRLAAGYIAIAPAVILSSRLAVYRGYLQGRGHMLPSALSEIVEQGAKAVLSLFFALLFRGDVYIAVSLALMSVSLSEAVALAFMRRSYLKLKPASPLFRIKADGTRVIKFALPVALTSLVLPLSGMADGVFAVRRLSRFFPSALSLYGIFSGGALTIISLPVALCHGLAAAIIPKISAAREEERGKNVLFSLAITAAIALPFSAALFFFAPLSSALFPSFTAEEKAALIRLVKILSFSAAAHSCAQTLSACLTGSGAAWKSAGTSLCAAILKTAAYLFLINEKNGVFALAYAANVCYFSLFVLNLFMNLTIIRRKYKFYDYDSRLGRFGRRPYEKRRGGYPFGRKSSFKERKNIIG